MSGGGLHALAARMVRQDGRVFAYDDAGELVAVVRWHFGGWEVWELGQWSGVWRPASWCERLQDATVNAGLRVRS